MIDDITSLETVDRWVTHCFKPAYAVSKNRNSVNILREDQTVSVTELLSADSNDINTSPDERVVIKLGEDSDSFHLSGHWDGEEIDQTCPNNLESLFGAIPPYPTTKLEDIDTESEGFPYQSEPIDVGSLDDRFGILIPENNLRIRKQTGGMAIRQTYLDGTYIPLSEPSLRQGYPEWMPENKTNPDEKHAVTKVDINTRPKRDYLSNKANTLSSRDFNTLPEWVKDRGKFYNFDEFMHWLRSDDVWHHWSVNLVSEVRKWNYDPNGNINDRDLTEMWDTLSEIWDAIDERLPFTYELQKKDDIKAEDSINTDIYPPVAEGIRWIKITGSKESGGRLKARWAEELKGEIVMLLYPNSD